MSHFCDHHDDGLCDSQRESLEREKRESLKREKKKKHIPSGWVKCKCGEWVPVLMKNGFCCRCNDLDFA